MEGKIQGLIGKANNGDVMSMEILGDCYVNGYGVEKDEATAHKYYMMAAERGSIKAKYMVGMDYLLGEGVKKSTIIAETHIKAAANAGYAKAQYMMGLLYQNEEITCIFSKDKKAFSYFEKAAVQGHGKAQIELSGAYFGGVGVKANLGEGLFWLVCAYLHGDNDAEVRDEALEKLNGLIHSGVPGGRDRINGIINDVKAHYPQYIKERS